MYWGIGFGMVETVSGVWACAGETYVDYQGQR